MLWFDGPEFETLDKDSWPSLKVGDKFKFFSENESKSNDVFMCNVICKESEKNRDNEVFLCDVMDSLSVKVLCVHLPSIRE